MALFTRRVPLLEATRTVREALTAEGTSAPELHELIELIEQFRHKLAAPAGSGAQIGLQEMLDALPNPAGVLDDRGRLGSTNAKLDLLLGAGRSIGRTLVEATRSAELGEAAATATAVGGVATRREVFLPSLQRTVMASLAPLSGRRALVVLRDLSEQKAAETSRRDFVSNASHELRTPVAAIAGAAETLLGGVPLDPAARGFVEIIARHSQRLSRLAQELLDLSRLESGEFHPELSAVDLPQLFDEAAELVKARAQEKNVALAVDSPPALRALADRRALEQILVNLLDNAIKFTPTGGRVTLLADGTVNAVLLSVIDTGAGIEQRHLGRLFERFYRVDNGRARENGGTGLGLSIVKHLAQAQGGEVGVESGPGGSRFWVKLRSAPTA